MIPEPYEWLDRSERRYRRSLTVSLVALAFQTAGAVLAAAQGEWRGVGIILGIMALTLVLGARNRRAWRATLDESQLHRAEWKMRRER